MVVPALQNVDDFGVERLARLNGQLLHHVLQRQSAAILAVGGESIQIVDGREDSSSHGNLCALQSHRIAGAVPLLVVGADDGHDRVRKADAFQNLCPDQGMNLHLLELFGSKASGFGDNVFGHGQLANVVQQGGGVQRLQLGAADAQFLGDFNGIDPHTLQVIVRGLVLGFDREGEGLDGTQVEVRHFLDVAFLVLKFAEVQTVRAVDYIDCGYQEQRGLPVEGVIQPRDRAGDSSAYEIVGERPEVAVDQDAPQRPTLRQGDDGRDAARIGDEIDTCRQTQQQRMVADHQVRHAVVVDEVSQRG